MPFSPGFCNSFRASAFFYIQKDYAQFLCAAVPSAEFADADPFCGAQTAPGTGTAIPLDKPKEDVKRKSSCC